MASDVTVILDCDRVPTLPGIQQLAAAGNRNRATTTNRQFVEPMMKTDGVPDRVMLDIAFDAQTSGGLLISVEPTRGDELVERLRASGANSSCVVGHVTARRDSALILRG